MTRFRHLRILPVVLVFSLLPRVHAQTAPSSLTLEDCVRLAEAAPSAVVVARQQTDIAQLGLKQTQAAFLPQMQFDSGFVYNSPLRDNRFVHSSAALNGVQEYVFLLSTTQQVDLSGRLRADKQRASADLDAARAGETISQRDLKRAVAAAYYRLLLARHIFRALGDSVSEAESFEQRTQLLMDQGEASRADLAKASAATVALRRGRSEAELETRVASQELASFWTTAVNDALPIVDVFEPAPDAASLAGFAAGARPYVNRPEFSLLDAQKRSFLAESRRLRAELYPQANVTFQYGLDSTVVRARDRGSALFVSLNVPIFDWMRTLNASREFRTRADQTETQRAVQERAFAREFEAAQARLDSAQEQIALAGRQIQLGEEDLRLSRLRFEGGEGPALDVVAAQNQLAQSRVNYFTAIANYWNARADREVAAGQ